MGTEILNLFHKRIKKEYKLAFAATFLMALLIHFYKFVNTLPNHDSMYSFYSEQNVLGSGRWALSLACGISSYYDLPWVIGLISCCFIALTVVVIVALFQLKNPVLIGFVGAVIASSPAITETMFFLYTADGYMIAMFLAALAVYLTRVGENRVTRWGLSGLCICISCAIYQAYVSFALVLAVCYFMVQLLQDRYDKRDCLKWVLRQAIVYITSLAVYFVIWKLCMYVTGTEANEYLGIADVGALKFGADLISYRVISAFSEILEYFLQWSMLQHGISLYAVMNVLFFILLGVGSIIAVIRSRIWKRKWAFVLLIVCVAAIVPFAFIWYFASAHISYRPMMLQSLALLFVLGALLFEDWTGDILKNTMALLLALIVFQQAVMANISYFYMNLTYERSYAEAVEMMVEINDLRDEYEFHEIAVVGNRVADLSWEMYDAQTGKLEPAGKVHIFTGYLHQSLMIHRERVVPFLTAYLGLDLEAVSPEDYETISELPEVQSMECWPADGSVAVIDHVLVLKLSDME